VSIPPESIEVGKCYLVRTGRYDQPQGVRRVVRIMPDGRIQIEHRIASSKGVAWKGAIQDVRSFSVMAEREVPCDWTPGRDNEEQRTR
jgi:hypothetical protein